MWRADLMLYELDKASYGCTEEALKFKIHPDHYMVKIYLSNLKELGADDKTLNDLETWRAIHNNIIETLSSCYDENPASAKSEAARHAATQWLSRAREAKFEKRLHVRERKEQGLPAGDVAASASPTGVRSRDIAAINLRDKDRKVFPGEHAGRGSVGRMNDILSRGLSSALQDVLRELAIEYQKEVQIKLNAIKDEGVEKKIQDELRKMTDIFVKKG